ncbi:7 transmembrane receptor (rhodopsin family) domain-containing protein [Ditylenchus destructor]|uniref:7 transmembrane receptor (Rhodopsin family) domain-containing protein n=1 Tax=Ditylenchus destructor TaxID=166010 RepID=A0AAD4NBU9_9BILA|nr:7 transmembrane receptor (rhodopsin family) domain-containing protein [Ditylenchus destructor]
MDSSASPIQYVSLGDTIADIALSEKASAGLTATSSILLSVLVVATFISNTLLMATILSSYKLRNTILYLIFCVQALINLYDVITIMFISLLFVANGQWTFGDFMCKLNAWSQQFVFLKTLLSIVLMAIERALGLHGRHLVKARYYMIISVIFTAAACALATPTFLPNFNTRVYRFRYLCAIGSMAPVSYTMVQILIYGGCSFVLLVCFGSLFSYKLDSRSLPVKPQDYGSFIMESRALQDHLVLGRLVLFITLAYLFVQGPYICLSFFVQIRNSGEMIQKFGNMEMEIPQDVDTLLTWLRFFFPLIIFGTCHDIWTKLTNLIFCRRSALPVWSWGYGMGAPKNSTMMGPDNVLTLVATEDGLQLRVPTNYNSPNVNGQKTRVGTINSEYDRVEQLFHGPQLSPRPNITEGMNRQVQISRNNTARGSQVSESRVCTASTTTDDSMQEFGSGIPILKKVSTKGSNKNGNSNTTKKKNVLKRPKENTTKNAKRNEWVS